MVDKRKEGADAASSIAKERFSTQVQTPEDLLKSQTVGLVHLDEFRKRRVEALEAGTSSGWSTPSPGGDGLVRSLSMAQFEAESQSTD